MRYPIPPPWTDKQTANITFPRITRAVITLLLSTFFTLKLFACTTYQLHMYKKNKERLASLQKKQKHLQNERKMAAARGLVTDTEDANEESGSEYVTVDDSSDVEHSDLDKNHGVTVQSSSEDIRKYSVNY